MRAASTRRTLFAAAGSVVMGSGITAGAAASIADMVPRGSADAHLLAVCAKAEEEDRLLSAADRQHDLMQKCGSAAEVSKARDQTDVHFGAFIELAEQAAGIPAFTMDGMRAKARVLFLNLDTVAKEGDITSLILRDLGWGA